MVKIRIIIICAIICLLVSCKKKSGVVITFDDRYVDEWVWADSELSKYDWKATFSLTKIGQLNKRDISNIRMLQDKGHEIAGHGYKHVRAKNYVDRNGIETYMNNEILPMISHFKKDNLDLNSYVYPFGSRDSLIDVELLKYFDYLRGGFVEPENDSLHNYNCFYNDSSLLFGIGIDFCSTDNDKRNLIDKLLNYCLENEKVLILYGHKPVKKYASNYEVEIQTLKKICSFVEDNNMTFYTISDLSNY
jgi:peptidoglycan/xylan/chitin deacetylase (PgdA/CDA1 family)